MSSRRDIALVRALALGIGAILLSASQAPRIPTARLGAPLAASDYVFSSSPVVRE